jgi:geranylgeranyl reductase family protein
VTVEAETDVIVVGAGPAGSATAIHLARAGRSVLLLDKSTFPRSKVCGDGLTPRAIRELDLLGVDTHGEQWRKTAGLIIHTSRPQAYQLPWPELDAFPSYGAVRRREEFDDVLRRHAVAAGARFRDGVLVTGPLRDDTGRICGVETDAGQFRAPVVVAADGNSARLALAAGIDRDPSRPMGVAVRTYFRSPFGDDLWLHSWLELWDGAPGRSTLLPGYAWSFPLGDGVANVGLGLPSTAKAFGKISYRDLLQRWLAATPSGWGFTEENRLEPIGSAALPMGFNRHPAYRDGLMLVGDAAGVVSPFNGEGISSALETGRIAAEHIVAAFDRGVRAPAGEAELKAYPRHLADLWGGYYCFGRLFLAVVGQPALMRIAARHILPVPGVAGLMHKLMANLTNERPVDLPDRIVHLVSRIVPADRP